MERRKFIRNEIDEVLRTVTKAFTTRSEGYIVGGLAMMHHGVKLATKDVDIVFRSRGTTLQFVRTLERLGFRDGSPDTAREKKGKNFWKMEGPGGMRFDVFCLSVCNCLVVSESMAMRAGKYPIAGTLSYRVISPEDIFLFKSITDREDDLADMRMLAGMGLDWTVIEKELRSQPNFWNWIAHHYIKLIELENAYGIRSPLKRRFRPDAEIAAGMACLRPDLEKGPLTVRDARVILKERSDAFGAKVLRTMCELGIAQGRAGKFYYRRERTERRKGSARAD